MNVKLFIDKLFVYSEKNKKYFYTEFGNNVNIIYGKNTAGKSTVFQIIYYALGINDNKEYLDEILSENVIVRLDCKIHRDKLIDKLTFIRDDDVLSIFKNGIIQKTFNGINYDNSTEHIKLKNFMHDLFNFTLKLESKNEYTEAPMETIFLPYYTSQSVGWVYLMKSFSNLEFYKNFRNDYLDYYLGVENYNDRLEKIRLENELSEVTSKLNFFEKFSNTNTSLETTKLSDESFITETNKYLDTYIENQDKLQKAQENYISKCNELSYYKNRQTLLKKIKKNHKEQSPINGICPTCKQPIKFTIESAYKFFQEENDTESELTKIKEKIKKTQSEINGLNNQIAKYSQTISINYNILNRYKNQTITFDSWLKNKSNIKLIEEIDRNISNLYIDSARIKNDLKNYKTEKEIMDIRKQREKDFREIFESYLNELKVKLLKGQRYTSLYKISAFPSQGVELHKTVLAYNFAFNKIISSNSQIHRCPFMLDGIFKEDIENDNKKLILKFIGNNRPKDTQLIFSIAETKENENTIYQYKTTYFDEDTKLICIGDASKERAFLQDYDDSICELLSDTESLITSI